MLRSLLQLDLGGFEPPPHRLKAEYANPLTLQVRLVTQPVNSSDRERCPPRLLTPPFSDRIIHAVCRRKESNLLGPLDTSFTGWPPSIDVYYGM